MFAAELFWLQRHHDSAISKRRVVPGITHAVGAEHSRLRNAGNDHAAGTHAEREHVSLSAHYQRIIGGPQNLLVDFFAPVFVSIHLGLRLFDAETKLKRLSLHWHANAVQHFIGISSTM